MNTSKFTVANIVFTVTARLGKSGVKFPFDSKSSYKHNEFNITIKTDTGKTTFKFYGSELDYTNGKMSMDESELKNALYCFVSDACSADSSFEDFCSELGYDNDSRSAERIYNACKKSLAKFTRICPDADIYNVVNALND